MGERQLGESNLFLSPMGELIVKPLESMGLKCPVSGTEIPWTAPKGKYGPRLPTRPTIAFSNVRPIASSTSSVGLIPRPMFPTNYAGGRMTTMRQTPRIPTVSPGTRAIPSAPTALQLYQSAASRAIALSNPSAQGAPIQMNNIYKNVSTPWVRKSSTITSQGSTERVKSPWVSTGFLESSVEIPMALSNLLLPKQIEDKDPLDINSPSPLDSKEKKKGKKLTKAKRKKAKEQKKAQRRRIREAEALRNGPQRACKRPKTIKYFDNNDSEVDMSSDSSDDSFIPEEEIRERRKMGDFEGVKMKEVVTNTVNLSRGHSSGNQCQNRPYIQIHNKTTSSTIQIPINRTTSASAVQIYNRSIFASGVQTQIRPNHLSIHSTNNEILIDPTKSVAKQVRNYYHTNPSQAVVQVPDNDVVEVPGGSNLSSSRWNMGNQRSQMAGINIQIQRPGLNAKNPTNLMQRNVVGLALNRLHGDISRMNQNLNLLTSKPGISKTGMIFVCGYCGQKFTDMESCTQHKERSHSPSAEEIVFPPSEHQPQPTFVRSVNPCPFCNRQLLTNEGLLRHIKRNHKNESVSSAMSENRKELLVNKEKQVIEVKGDVFDGINNLEHNIFENDNDDMSIPIGIDDNVQEDDSIIDMNQLLQIQYSDDENDEGEKTRGVEIQEIDSNESTPADFDQNGDEFILSI